MITDEENIFIV